VGEASGPHLTCRAGRGAATTECAGGDGDALGGTRRVLFHRWTRAWSRVSCMADRGCLREAGWRADALCRDVPGIACLLAAL
jgi:hypothetical protein